MSEAQKAARNGMEPPRVTEKPYVRSIGKKGKGSDYGMWNNTTLA